MPSSNSSALPTFTGAEHTMLALLAFPNPTGLHPNEARWRDLARKLVAARNATIPTRVSALEGVVVDLLAFVGEQQARGFVDGVCDPSTAVARAKDLVPDWEVRLAELPLAAV